MNTTQDKATPIKTPCCNAEYVEAISPTGFMCEKCGKTLRHPEIRCAWTPIGELQLASLADKPDGSMSPGGRGRLIAAVKNIIAQHDEIQKQHDALTKVAEAARLVDTLNNDGGVEADIFAAFTALSESVAQLAAIKGETK